ncbi:MAG: hypothetical protein ABSF18_03480 [Gammaproteobacteria bacterium]
MSLTTLKFDELLPGDLLFVLNEEYSIDDSVKACYSGHVQIFTGEPLNPTVHAVNEGKFPATRATRLDDTSNYVVVRCNNPEIRARANALALQWAAYQLPYDSIRQSKIAELEMKTVSQLSKQNPRYNELELAAKKNEAIFENAEQAFTRTGVYKMIKYAARRDTAAMLPDELGGKRGFRCSMFACLVYQIACMGQLVASRNIKEQGWGSDKYADPQRIADLARPHGLNSINPFYYYQRHRFIEHYREYVESLQQRLHKQPPAHLKPAAIEAWDFEHNGDPATYNFDPLMPKSLKVDASLVTSGSLWYGIAHDQSKGFWSVAGVLPKENVPKLSPEERLEASGDLKKRAETGQQLRQEVKNQLKM